MAYPFPMPSLVHEDVPYYSERDVQFFYDQYEKAVAKVRAVQDVLELNPDGPTPTAWACIMDAVNVSMPPGGQE